MQLPDFIKRMLGFVEKAEANLTAEKDLATARARVTELEGQATTDKTAIGKHEDRVKELEGQLAAKDQEITTLKGEVSTEKKRANDTLAAQGLSVEHLPAAGAAETPGTSKEAAWTTYSRLMEKDPVAAGRFYSENAESILKSRPKAE